MYVLEPKSIYGLLINCERTHTKTRWLESYNTVQRLYIRSFIY